MRSLQLSELYDIAIVGSGFGGSLLAMIARRAGRSVLLLEKAIHPRFAIGESSTPLANLLLEELAERFDLPRLKPLTKWGTWQRAHPELACGLKRGFSFYHHSLGGSRPRAFDREQQLLVAASPSDEVSDTHWYRADVDHFFVRQAVAMGVDYLDQVQLTSMTESNDSVALDGERLGGPVSFRCRFLVDATGPRGFVSRARGIEEAEFADFAQTQAIYTHFRGVKRFLPGGSTESAPFPVDDAALHHIFNGGWIWVLRFNNGVTSAGVAASRSVADRLRFHEGARAWPRLLEHLPAVREQFADAKAERPFVHVPRLSYLAETIAGRRWAMLPSAAAFVDPLLSTGFPLTLLGVERLGEIITNDWDTPAFVRRLQTYAAETGDEARAAAQLISTLYAVMGNFRLFRSVSFLYFAAASFAETARRLGRPERAPGFLLCEHPDFWPVCAQLCDRARRVSTEADARDLEAAILNAIEPFNIAGLGVADRRNWFPADTEDLLRGAGKLGATPEEIHRLIARCGLSSAPALGNSLIGVSLTGR